MRNGKLIVFGAALASSIASAALAQQGMPDTRAMTCTEVQGLMGRSGAALLRTGENTYNRYVRDVSFCPRGDVVKPDWVPTKNGACYVGGICWDPSTDSGRGGR